MPYIGVGLYLALAIYFAVHVVKSGRELYWLWILFMFPLLGSIVYLFAAYLPESRIPLNKRLDKAFAGRTVE